MKIEEIEIKNWRSLEQIKVNISELTDSSKELNESRSDILSSIMFFFGFRNPERTDFRNPRKEIFVGIKFTDLDLTDKIEYEKFLSYDGKLVLTKTVAIDSSEKNFQDIVNGDFRNYLIRK